MDKQYLDKDGLQVIVDNVKEAKEVATGAIALAQAAMEGLIPSEDFITPVTETNKIAMTDRLLNEHSIGDKEYTFAKLEEEMYNTWFANWSDDVNFPDLYGTGIFIVGKDRMVATIIYFVYSTGRIYRRLRKRINDEPVWGDWELMYSGMETISNAFTLNPDTVSTAGELSVLKQGNLVQFKVYLESIHNVSESTWVTLGNVVDSIKPKEETILTISDGSTVSNTSLARITPTGELQIWGASSLNGRSSRFSAMYFTNQ